MTKIDLWLRKNKLNLNYNKSSYTIIGNRWSKKNTFNLTIKNNVIPQSNTVKYLCMILDNNLTWQPHVDKISEKLSKSCGMVFKLCHYVPLSTLKLIYYDMFNSILLSFTLKAKLWKSISMPFAENQEFTKSFLWCQSIPCKTLSSEYHE